MCTESWQVAITTNDLSQMLLVIVMVPKLLIFADLTFVDVR